MTLRRVTCHSSSETDSADSCNACDPCDPCDDLYTIEKIVVKTLTDVGLSSDPEETGKSFAENARIKAYATRDAIAASLRSDLADYVILAEDSGLCVDALGGAPGIHSARFAEGGQDDSAHADDNDNNAKLLAMLRDVPAEKRTAHFVTAACVLVPKCVGAGVPNCATSYNEKSAQPGVTGNPSTCHMSTSRSTRCDRLPVNVSQNVTSYPSRCHEYDEYNVEAQLHGHIANEPIGENGFGYDPLFYPEEYGGKLTNGQINAQQKSEISHRGKAIRKVAEILHQLQKN